MMTLNLSVKEIDDLLQHIYRKLKGRKEGLSLAEPASILLAGLKRENPAFYIPQLDRFSPIIIDALISKAYESFGYDGLASLSDISDDVAILTGDYVPEGAEEGLAAIRAEIGSIASVLEGSATAAEAPIGGGEEGAAETAGFFRECAWAAAGLPLVSLYSAGDIPFGTGRVARARVEVRITGEWSIRKRHDPVVTFDHIPAEPNSPFESQIRTAMRAGEAFAVSSMGMRAIERMPREYRISLPEIASLPPTALQRLTGGSAGLAIAVLLASVLGGLDLHRYRPLIKRGTAFTGMVDDEGKILPVDDSHIRSKVRAVFFSRYARLVLPVENMGTARDTLSSLLEAHPSRRLDLVPVSNMEEVFGEPAVTVMQKRPSGKLLLQRLFFWRKHLAAAIPVLAFALIFPLFIFPRYLDNRVVEMNHEGNILIMKNRWGERVGTFNTGFPTRSESNCRRFFYGDLLHEDGNEVLCALSESRRSRVQKSDRNRLHLMVFSDRGELLRRYVYDEEELVDYGSEPWAQEKGLDMIRNSGLYAKECGRGWFFTVTHHGTFTPASVIRFSLEDGSREVFLHKGFLPEMAIKDFDGDGAPDILVAGFNKSLDAPVIIVLDPEHMSGSSPAGHCYEGERIRGDVAKYFVKLPEMDFFLRRTNQNYPLTTTIIDTRDTLRVAVKGSSVDVLFFIVKGMVFSRTEVCLGQSTGAIKPDEITRIDYDGKELDEKDLLDNVLFWDGEEWVPGPVINSSYLRIVEEAETAQKGSGR